MKRALFIFTILLFVSFSYAATSTPSHIGLGFYFGQPTGISIGWYLSDHQVLNGVVGWAFNNKNGILSLSADYTYRWNVASSPGKLFLYAGIGVSARIGSDSDLGLRIPLGIAFFTPEIPLELLLEIAPGMRLIPATTGNVEGGLGIRWKF
jgi:hypothetical protein